MTNSFKRKAIAVGLALCSMAGVASAYFTDADTAANHFTVGKVSLDLQEPNWDPDDTDDITPNEEVAKDPQVLNNGVNEEFIFLEVQVPVAEITLAAVDGTKAGEKAAAELFTYSINTGWTQLDTNTAADAENGLVSHRYVYGTADTCTALAKGTTTPTLFDTVKFANVVEDEGLEDTDLSIVINAYGIQTTALGSTGSADSKQSPEAVWTLISNAQPSTEKGTEDAKTDILQ